MQIIKTIDSYFYKALGTQIRNIRQEKNITLTEVASKTGYSRPLIDRWELGLAKIKPCQFEILCDVLDVSKLIKVDVKIGI